MNKIAPLVTTNLTWKHFRGISPKAKEDGAERTAISLATEKQMVSRNGPASPWETEPTQEEVNGRILKSLRKRSSRWDKHGVVTADVLGDIPVSNT